MATSDRRPAEPLTVDELRQIIDGLRDAWLQHGDAELIRQPAARRGRKFSNLDVARATVVHGLACHVYETARAVLVLMDSGLTNAAVPLVRQMYECALTSVWIVQSSDQHGVTAVLHEHARNRAAVAVDVRDAQSEAFREAVEKIRDADPSPFVGSFDSVRQFRDICLDLVPGGIDAYLTYRVLSTYSHASVGIADLYYAPAPPGAVGVPHRRTHADTAFAADTLLYFAASTLVWSGRAYSYVSRDQVHRSLLRSAARSLGTPAEIHLSDHYRRRHARQRKAR